MGWKCVNASTSQPDEVVCQKEISFGDEMSLEEVFVMTGIVIVVLLTVPILGGLFYLCIRGLMNFFQRRRKREAIQGGSAMEAGWKAAASTPGPVPGACDADGEHWTKLQCRDP